MALSLAAFKILSLGAVRICKMAPKTHRITLSCRFSKGTFLWSYSHYPLNEQKPKIEDGSYLGHTRCATMLNNIPCDLQLMTTVHDKRYLLCAAVFLESLRTHARTNACTDARTDRGTDKCKTVYPPPTCWQGV